MKKIIITGGLGFIGSNLVEYLFKKKYVTIVVDNFSYSSNLNNLKNFPKDKIKIIKCDINQKKKIEQIIKKYKPECIFNLAAETHVDRSIDNPDIFIKSNINGVYNLLEALKKFKKVRLIHISTDEVYGDISKGKFSKEKDSYDPSSPYAASKAASDLLVKSYVRTYKLDCIITNCSNNYGPKQFPEKLIPKIILNLMLGKNIPIYGNGKNEREWIHVYDHCAALYKIYKNGKSGDQINIGSGEVYSNIKIAKSLLYHFNKLYGKTFSKIIFVKDRPGHDKRYALNSTKLKKQFKWGKKYNFNAGLIHTLKWYIKNKEWILRLNKSKFTKRMGS